MLSEQDVIEIALQNPVNARLLTVLDDLDLPQCMLVAGCLFQALWNERSGRPLDWGVKDYDVAYFDENLSWDAEDRVIQRVREACGELADKVEVRNQARVHLWYEARFGVPYAPLLKTTDGIDRYLVTSTCIGLDVRSRTLYSSHGLDDLREGVLRSNPLNHQPEMFLRKARSYQERWNWLTIAG
ncbi:nucleotidyltransferase family protein [Pseudomonas sp. 5P_5.1_Bac1]|uniref:nucleotidyltransferase family protein n=1 Tax=Pseudomonas sp. 5P_5.1_Bac1 TaxID=2971616 RepID=UPI0021C66719|nr:nucleotidyltransferase family protein [Pseudomonas sp. 5P_5.1_Bac1]MCU1720925.1 nucleotidyltransferase family protein [Pseudomonas sp. 5P_5.1_Bac1]